MRLFKIGRDLSCDIVLQSPRVSALHAEITVLDNGDILLEDKNSTNGTFIMNQPVKPGVQVNIKRGDAIRFADVELIWAQIPEPEDNSAYKAIYGIGSNFRNEIQISGNTASRFHATLKIDKKGHAVLQDHSKNGTTVNGQKIKNGQTVKVSKNDSVVCGGVPVNLNQYIPSIPVRKIIGLVASVVIIACCGFGVWKWIDSNSFVSPKTDPALANGVAMVYGGYYYTAKLKDDPFEKDNINWPSEWIFFQDGYGNLVNTNNVLGMGNLYTNTDEFNGQVKPFGYSGTAFFISSDGELGTNRHVAIPWEYHKDEYEDDIHNFIRFMYDVFSDKLAKVSSNDGVEMVGKSDRVAISEIEISGRFSFFGIGLCGTKINSNIDLQQCQVIAESGDEKKDVALIRLNSRKTPDYIIEMGAIYDIEKARTDEQSLKLQDENLTIIGYPLGETVSNQSFDGKELRPTTMRATLSGVPDDNHMQVQTVSLGGQSGSPVIDSKHRLVGVLWGGFRGTEVTYCCNIKHLKELYDKNKVRK